jgi:hypothetical protein
LSCRWTNFRTIFVRARCPIGIADSQPQRHPHPRIISAKKVGTIGQYFFRKDIDDEWLMDQVLSMSKAGFAPSELYSVIDRLSKLSPDLPDRVAEVLAALVKNPRFDRWVYMTQSAAVRAILENGLASGSPVTASVVTETINYFSAMGDSSYLDLLTYRQMNKA